jgi:uncharacterized protein YecE (DUF72 family)
MNTRRGGTVSAIGEIRVGPSGRRYPPWRKEFCPAGLVRPRDLEGQRKLEGQREPDGQCELARRGAQAGQCELAGRREPRARHPSFTPPEALALALRREHDVALVVAGTVGKWPCTEDQTTDFSYVRLHSDVGVGAPRNARKLAGLLGVAPPSPNDRTGRPSSHPQ